VRTATGALLGVALSSAVVRAAIVPAVDRVARQAIFPPTNPTFACVVPPPSADLPIPPPYVDDASSVITPASRAAYLAAVAPVLTLRLALDAAIDAFLASDEAHAGPADCLLAILDTWARGDAFLGAVSDQGTYEVKWTLVSLGRAWAHVRPRATPAVRERVDAWLRTLVAEMQASFPAPGSPGTRNNHVAWAAAAAMTVATAIDDVALFVWGLARAGWALNEVQPDGTLPLELARGPFALHYHVFTVTPLALVAAMAGANGIDLWSAGGGVLERLAARTLVGLLEPASFADLTGVPQRFGLDALPAPPPDAFAWVEIWQAHARRSDLHRLLAPLRPLRHSLLGGNVTLAYGVPAGNGTLATTTTSTTTTTTTSAPSSTTVTSSTTTTTVPAVEAACSESLARLHVTFDGLDAPNGQAMLHLRGRLRTVSGALSSASAARLRVVVHRGDAAPLAVAARLERTRAARCVVATTAGVRDARDGGAVAYARIRICPASARDARFAVSVVGAEASPPSRPFVLQVSVDDDAGLVSCGTVTVHRCIVKRSRARCR
jgi:poly(beta-D-mannuronate) lyase